MNKKIYLPLIFMAIISIATLTLQVLTLNLFYGFIALACFALAFLYTGIILIHGVKST